LNVLPSELTICYLAILISIGHDVLRRKMLGSISMPSIMEDFKETTSYIVKRFMPAFLD
jgi:hypothetical protein